MKTAPFTLIQGIVVGHSLFTQPFASGLSTCHGACCWQGGAGAPLEPWEPVGEAFDGLRTANIVLHFVALQSRSAAMLLHRASFRIIFARSRLTNTSPTGSQEAETLQRLYPKLAPHLSQAGRNQVTAKGTSYTWRKEALVGLNHARASLASIYRHGVDLLGRVTPSSVYRYRDKHRTTVLDFGLCAIQEDGIIRCGIQQAYRAGAVDFEKPISCHLYPLRRRRNWLGMEYPGIRRDKSYYYEQRGICESACGKGRREGLAVFQFVRDAIVRQYGEGFYEKLEEKYVAFEERVTA